MQTRKVLKNAKRRILDDEFNRLLDNLDLNPILDNRSHQVRWLYKNSNKLTIVYEERLVRLLVSRLQQRIKQLENEQLSRTHSKANYGSKDSPIPVSEVLGTSM